ncbi:MAG: hypothetical protein QY322_04590 [bacterium]|nr:MAG: hypothetical protein QY322_04590 [bacterium]
MTSSADDFYTDPEYKKKQSEISKRNWAAGIYNYKIKALVTRSCKRTNCNNKFLVKPYDHKTYCSQRCSALINNTGRKMSESTKMKISKTLKALPNRLRGKHFSKPKIKIVCLNCHKSFELVPYLAKTQKYCSIHCNIVRLGRKTTSPKASKGKNGIRIDISPTINFYSTWEANVARIYNLIGLKWEYAPSLFDLGKHTYRPDFYLSEFKTYVEVKNFMNEYSLMRDKTFRERFPKIQLDLITKKEYLEIKSNYKDLVEDWEN